MDPITATQILKTVKRQSSTINNIVLVVMPIAAIIGGYYWYKQNIWKPKVSVVSVDYVSGNAIVNINGTEKTLYSGSTLTAGFGWGVRFAGNSDEDHTRIELVKNDLTHETIDKA